MVFKFTLRCLHKLIEHFFTFCPTLGASVGRGTKNHIFVLIPENAWRAMIIIGTRYNSAVHFKNKMLVNGAFVF